jgi:hypothetical protein
MLTPQDSTPRHHHGRAQEQRGAEGEVRWGPLVSGIPSTGVPGTTPLGLSTGVSGAYYWSPADVGR